MILTPKDQEVLNSACNDIKRARRIMSIKHGKTKFQIRFLNEQGNCEITYHFKGTINDPIYEELRQVAQIRKQFPQAKISEMAEFKKKVKKILKAENKLYKIMVFTTLHWWSLYTDWQKTNGQSVRDFVKDSLLKETNNENPSISVKVRSNGNPQGLLFTKIPECDNNQD